VGGLEVVQRLPHVSICCEDDGLQAIRHIWHLRSFSPSLLPFSTKNAYGPMQLLCCNE
jgi:hypothetical protein